MRRSTFYEPRVVGDLGPVPGPSLSSLTPSGGYPVWGKGGWMSSLRLREVGLPGPHPGGVGGTSTGVGSGYRATRPGGARVDLLRRDSAPPPPSPVHEIDTRDRSTTLAFAGGSGGPATGGGGRGLWPFWADRPSGSGGRGREGRR